MKDPSVGFLKELKIKLDQIEKLLQDKKCKEALAEIRDLETQKQILLPLDVIIQRGSSG
jgi:hypothetical protein